ncbi:MAG: type II toxin-antitoxin system ParD family antitoxin, partial [Sphaerospermopsis kisseleviana]
TMRAYVEELVAQGGYSSVSEYFWELVRQDQKLQSKITTTNHAFRRFELWKYNRNDSTRLGRYTSRCKLAVMFTTEKAYS